MVTSGTLVSERMFTDGNMVESFQQESEDGRHGQDALSRYRGEKDFPLRLLHSTDR